MTIAMRRSVHWGQPSRVLKRWSRRRQIIRSSPNKRDSESVLLTRRWAKWKKRSNSTSKSSRRATKPRWPTWPNGELNRFEIPRPPRFMRGSAAKLHSIEVEVARIQAFLACHQDWTFRTLEVQVAIQNCRTAFATFLHFPIPRFRHRLAFRDWI